MAIEHTLSFQSATGHMQMTVTAGDTVLIAGPNGVGKSALLATLYRSISQHLTTYLPGHRQINFNNGWENAGQDATQLRNNLFQGIDNFSRYKGAWAEDQFKVTIKTLLHAEAAFNRNFRRNGPSNVTQSAKDGTLRESPIDTLNLIFDAARLPVSFDLTDQGLSAVRGSAVYAIDALSDGERAALFLVAAIVTMPADGVIFIDEPEKHLHPSITGLLLEAALRAKRDATVVLSSHDVHLIEQLEVTNIVHVRDSRIINLRPETRIYEATLISGPQTIPEDLKRDLLGTRSTILFVEGEASSSDLALYGHIYEGVKVSPKGGHAQVSEAVKALKLLDGFHWINPFGLVDGDGRDENEIAALNERRIYVLPCPTIENLFFLPEAIDCFASADNEYILGKSSEQRTENLLDLIIDVASNAKEDIIAKRAAWLLERRLSESKLSPKVIKDKTVNCITVSVDEIINKVSEDVEKILQNDIWSSVIFNLPIKNTQLPSAVSSAVGAKSFDKYCQVILRQLDLRSDASKPLLAKLRNILPALG